MTRSAPPLVVLSLLAGLATPAWAQSPPLEVWVLNEARGSISVIDPRTSAVVHTIDVADPDGDRIPDPPRGLAFSTRPAAPGRHAFVTQGRLLTVVSVGTRAIVHVVDVSAIPGVGPLTLGGCAASVPRDFLDSAGLEQTRSLLHVAGTLAAGGTSFFVFDQDVLVAGGSPLVARGTLSRDGTAHDVRVLDAPAGAAFQRAWYTVVTTAPTPQVLAIEVTGPRSLAGSWSARAPRVDPLPTLPSPPAVLRPGAPPGRELPVLPLATAGVLENLDTGGTCSPGGDLGAVSVSGPGANSYTVLALDRASHDLVLVDPTDCSTTRFPSGAGPADVATIGRLSWTTAFVANHDADTVTRLDEDGTLTTIPISPGGEPCDDCPVAIGVAGATACDPAQVAVHEADADLDGQIDDLLLEWDAQGCPATGPFWVWCQCIGLDDPACPCACDCGAFPQPEDCECPGMLAPGVGATAGVLGAGDQLQVPPWDPDPLEKPWKRLGTSVDDSFAHLGVLSAGGEGWVYTVTLQETYP